MPTLEDLGLEAAQYLRDNQELNEITVSVKKTTDGRAAIRVDVADANGLFDYYQAEAKILPPLEPGEVNG
jgi:hypothetical protein